MYARDFVDGGYLSGAGDAINGINVEDMSVCQGKWSKVKKSSGGIIGR